MSQQLRSQLERFGFAGDIETSLGSRQRYATDASIYEILPHAIAFPKHTQDVQILVTVAAHLGLSITPRGAGTSLAGQAIGTGIIIDLTRYFNQILSIDIEQGSVTLQPGVVLDHLNQTLKPHGLWLPIDTSTANRCVIGGVIGNNSCGAYSLRYKTPREHIVSLSLVTHDARLLHFSEVTDPQTFQAKKAQQDTEGQWYTTLDDILTTHAEDIRSAFPDPSIIRRNTGYALDHLLTQGRWSAEQNDADIYANLAPFVCGSEGTLGIVTEATFKLSPLPQHRALLVFHFHDVFGALDATQHLIASGAAAVELIDAPTLIETEQHAGLSQHRFWLLGNPQAVQVVEYFASSTTELEQLLEQGRSLADQLIEHACYACALVRGAEMASVWEVRKAGLGLLMGKVTKKKAVAVIEDAAVPVAHLSHFMQDIRQLMGALNVNCIYYGHASVGLIHLRPELDLSDADDKKRFSYIATEVSHLVKRYHGALSGEHGDGRLRAPFLPEQFGPVIYAQLKRLKHILDPYQRMNPGKIIATEALMSDMRIPVSGIKTLARNGYNWEQKGGFGLAVESCNGAGACRKQVGAMCPTFQATQDDAYATRGRANLLRFALQHPNPKHAMSQAELQIALNTCLGCKACQSECPASVDMAKLKSEVLFQTLNQFSFKTWLYRNYHRLFALTRHISIVISWFNKHPNYLSRLIPSWDKRRKLPCANRLDLTVWWRQHAANNTTKNHDNVLLFIDIFTKNQHPERGIASILVMEKLGFNVIPIWLTSSSRLLISNGLLDSAKQELTQQWRHIQTLLETHPQADMVGIEPAELLVWRDDALSLLDAHSIAGLRQQQNKLMLWDEWLLKIDKQRTDIVWPTISSRILLHVHCHQKALAQVSIAQQCLSLLSNGVDVIPGGCCGMSGSFGYDHPDLSIKIAQQHFLPAISQADADTILVTCGSSCHQQALDLAQKEGLHSAEVFAKAWGLR